MDLYEGDRFRDPQLDREFTVQRDIDTVGLSVMEMDGIAVPIEFDNGEWLTVPHERFRGRATYDLVERGGV